MPQKGGIIMHHTGTQLLQSQRLLLRPFQLSDADSCVNNWATDPATYRYLSQEPRTPQQVCDWLSTAKQAYASPETYYWAIVEKSSNQVVGEIFVDDFSSRNRWCELDWKVGQRVQSNGYATQAAMLVLNYLRNEVGFHRIQAKCCVENHASQRVMEKLGMVPEGVLHDFFLGKDGRWMDVVMYALLG